MDVVYPLKASRLMFPELRYSLRSLANLEHDRVFFVGGCPEWTVNTHHVPTNRLKTKYKDAGNNILTACQTDEISDPFILMNDDFFVLQPVDEVPVLNRGRVSDVMEIFRRQRALGKYFQGMKNTVHQLEALGYEDPLSFELHVPLVVHKEAWLETRKLRTLVDTWHIRTAYGAVTGLQGETIKDVKIYDRRTPLDRTQTFVSTQDESFQYGRIGRHLRGMLMVPSPYETGFPN